MKPAGNGINAASKKLNALQSTLDNIQKDLAPLDALLKKIQLKTRVARLQAESVRRIADDAGIRLGGVKTGPRSKTILPRVIGSIIALMTMGGAMAIRHGVWEKTISTVKKVKGPREGKEA